MPLVKTILDTELSVLMDEDFANFGGFPDGIIEASQRWSDVVDAYASAVIPSTTTASSAKTAFQGVIASITVDGLVKFPLAFTAYAGALAVGMLPTFTGVPPPIPIVFDSAFAIGNAGGSGADVADAMSVIIDTWFKTGTAINISSGATVPWS